ncbi:MAG: zeta toxin family protein [Bacteroidaceae bacterium]|nr:zeta toxin family protein [Bacteroidaceae bacterium]
MKLKTLYIIAGCNGAGKTTASITVLPEILQCKEFVNADEIAKGLSPFNPENVAIEAGRLMLQRIDTLVSGSESFAIETTLSTKSYSKLIEKAKSNGFQIQLLFFWLPTPEHAIERVAQRVKEGGHNIPIEVIRRRYQAGIENLFHIYMPIVDSWMLIENQSCPRIIVADGSINTENIYNVELFNTIKNICQRKNVTY